MSQAEKDLIEEINAAVEAFQYLISERHRDGAERYGEITFLGNDVVRMMLEELANTVNYCTMQAVKLLILQKKLEESGQATEMGITSFEGTKKVGWE